MENNLPSDVFKFVNVRPPQKITSDKLEISFIKHPFERIVDDKSDKNAYEVSLEERNGTILYSDIQNLTEKANYSRTLVESKVSKWVSPSRFDSVAQIYKKYSRLQSIVDWLQNHKNDEIRVVWLQSHKDEEAHLDTNDTFTNLITIFLRNLKRVNGQRETDSLDGNVQYDLEDLQLRFWDILIREVVNGEDCNNQLKEEATLLIKVTYLIALAWSGKGLKLVPATILNKIIVLPEFFPLPVITNDNSIATAENSYVNVAKGDAQKKGKLVIFGGNLVSLDDICTEQIDLDPCAPAQYIPLPQGHGQVKMLGVGDLLVVKKQLIKYEAGEIAYIENVMATEKRERKLRNLEREEVKTELETETETETETELTTSDKFDLEQESNEIIKSDSSLEAGLTISAKYGAVNASASLNYAKNNSKEESNKTASKISKETTSRAVSKITERVKELRSKLTVKEIEETNTHSFDNTKGENKTGIYQFVDKIYRAQVYNYGARLFIELIVPRPAAQYIYFKANNNNASTLLVKPIHPNDYTDSVLQIPLTSYEQIDRSNYSQWAAVYNAQDITAPPDEVYKVAKAYNLDYTPKGKEWHDYAYNDLEVKEGYEASEGYLNIGLSASPADAETKRYIEGFLGNKYFKVKKITVNPLSFSPLDTEMRVVPFSFRGYFNEFNINVEIICNLTPLAYDTWRINTFNSIMNAYQQQLDDYNAKLAQMEFGTGDFGDNPNINRIIEAEEIKKGCIQLITDQHFDSFDALKYNRGTNHYPEFGNAEAKKEGEYIQFFEQAFEWTQMTYWFYPYFWGNKPQWTIIKQYEDNDPLFTKFLQAGAARVILPVRPNYEKAVQHYLSTGQIWSGGETPCIDDLLFLSIVEEVKAADDQTQAEPVDALPWEVKVPTNFVILSSAKKELPKYSVHKDFIIDENGDKKDDNYSGLIADPNAPNADIYVWKS